MSEAEIVKQFYKDVWEQQNYDLVPSIMDIDIIFRGSLGESKRGMNEFIEYAEMIHQALADYKCEIIDMVAEPASNGHRKIAVQMQFSGRHIGKFFGVDPTDLVITWDGAAFFEFQDQKITRLWVLGDVDTLKKQLRI